MLAPMVTAEKRLAFTVTAPAPRTTNRRTAARQTRAVADTVAWVQELLDRFPPDELAEIAAHVRRALDAPPASAARAAFARELAGGRDWTPAERVALEAEARARAARWREELLADAWGAPEVAAWLGTTRQTPHDRVKRGRLLGVMDRGALRFPPWQFDPDGPDRLVPGLAEAVRALDLPPLAKVGWFVRPNPFLEGRAPIDVLRAGERERVLDAASGTGPR